jgi:hypothetical protein
LKTINIPEGVKEIGEYAFGGTGIKTVTIPSSVTKMDDRVFSSCSNLNEIIFKGCPSELGEQLSCYTYVKRIVVPQGKREYFLERLGNKDNCRMPEIVEEEEDSSKQKSGQSRQKNEKEITTLNAALEIEV